MPFSRIRGSDMENILATTNLTKAYKKTQALSGCNMHVPRGSIYGFVGRNGAGKTTLFRVVGGLQRPTAGSYSICGVVNGDKKGIERMRERTGAIIESPSIFGELSAMDNLRARSKILGIYDESALREMLSLVGLPETGKKKAKSFSLGMRQRLGIAGALLGSPDLLVLDEPMNGLDPEGIVEMRELILKLNQKREISFLISSHILDELARTATHFGFIERGRIVEEISSEELHRRCRKNTRLQVSDTAKLAPVLDEMGFEYTIESKQMALVYDEIHVTPFVLSLNERGIDIEHMETHDESLESYYIRLMGGEK